MTVKQASQRLGISPSRLYQLVAARQIVHYRIGGKIIFQEDDVAAFLAGCRVGTAAVPTAAPPLRLRLKHITLDRGS
jgi:excisionase family DNA binding protein